MLPEYALHNFSRRCTKDGAPKTLIAQSRLLLIYYKCGTKSYICISTGHRQAVVPEKSHGLSSSSFGSLLVLSSELMLNSNWPQYMCIVIGNVAAIPLVFCVFVYIKVFIRYQYSTKEIYPKLLTVLFCINCNGSVF